MTSTLNKRHQARNEKTLQELIKTVPGNERCADCQTRNPGWASWSLGIFLCMRCASLHRKLGTHISKVKSLSMDSWSNDQVENMKKFGNATSNKMYNPQNTRPPVPLDVDEVDSAMERFIRQKYEQKAFTAGAPDRRPAARLDTGGTGSSDDHPPPPPPKPNRRFGFGLRSSSALPLSGKQNHETAKNTPGQGGNQSKIFGASIGVSEDGMEWKLLTLKEMGFPDDKRNSNILKGLNGDLERAIESLVRLGEGSKQTQVSSPQSSQVPSRRNTPITNDGSSRAAFTGAAIQVSSQTQPTQQRQQVQNASDQGGRRPYNPFEAATTSHQPSLESDFQNMNLGKQQPQQVQPLFPNATGGYPQHQEQIQQARLQQSMTPPIPPMSQQFSYNNLYDHQQRYNPFTTSPQPPQPMTANPYLPSQQAFAPSNPYLNQSSLDSFLTSPNQPHFQQSPQQPWIQQPQQIQQAQQPLVGSPTQFYSPQSYTSANMLSPYGQTNLPAQHQQPAPLPLTPQRTGRVDKSSILALYNYPQLAPTPASPEAAAPTEQTEIPSPQPQPAKLPAGVSSGPQRSVTMPVAGSKNPFLSSAAQAAHQTSGATLASPDSTDSGRHSPDAFASLSARFVR